jgi:Ca-activated chloride channel homolog
MLLRPKMLALQKMKLTRVCHPLSAASRLIFSAFIAFSFLEADTAGTTAVSTQICAESQRREIRLTAVDDQGSLIENLSKDDLVIKIKENNLPGEIINLEYKRAEPLSVALLIDASTSMENSLVAVKGAATKFVQSLHAGKDQAALVTFAGEAKVEQALTTDFDRLGAAIAQVKFIAPPGYIGGGIVVSRDPVPKSTSQTPVGATAIWDAISHASQELFPPGNNTRRVIILFSDGEDTGSVLKMRDAIKAAVINNIEIVSIAVGDDWNFGINRAALRKLSEETGGQSFFPKKGGDLENILQQLEAGLSSRYSMTYCAREQKPGKAGQVEIITNSRLHRSKIRLFYPRNV